MKDDKEVKLNERQKAHAGPEKSGKGNLRNGAIIAATVVVSYFMFKPTEVAVTPPSPAPSMRALTQAPPREEVQAPDLTPEMARPATEGASTNDSADAVSHNALLRAGMQMIPTRPSEHGLQFFVRFKTSPMGCQLGDFDFLKGVTSSYTSKSFVISIEPLHPQEDDPIASLRVSLGDIESGKDLLLTLPPHKTPEQARDYGVYLCMDANRAGKCAKKETLSPKFWNAMIAKKKAVDRIVHFVPITIKSDIAYLIPSQDWSANRMKELKPLFEPVLETTDSLDSMKQILSVITSLPGKATSKGLELNLPQKHPNCRR